MSRRSTISRAASRRSPTPNSPASPPASRRRPISPTTRPMPTFRRCVEAHKRFDAWLRRNVVAHKRPGYAAVTLSLKRTGPRPATPRRTRWMAADLADRFARRTPGFAPPEPHPVRCGAQRSLRALAGGRSRVSPNPIRPRDRHHRLPQRRFLRPRQCPRHSHRDRDPGTLRPGASGKKSANWRSRFRLHQFLRPPPCRPYRRARRR